MHERSIVSQSLITDTTSLLSRHPGSTCGHREHVVDTDFGLIEETICLSSLVVPAVTGDHTLRSLFQHYFGCFSQSVACIATRFGECSPTLLDKLWYLYSYIYNTVSSNTTTLIIPILLFLVVVILMPPTTRSATSSIVSPSPYLPRTRSFTMTDFTPFTDWSFEFAPHPTCPAYHNALNNIYSEPFEPAFVATLFTDASRTVVSPNVIAALRAGIVETILLTSTATRTVITPVINQMLLFCRTNTNTRRFPLRTPATFTAALTSFLATNITAVVIRVATTPV